MKIFSFGKIIISGEHSVVYGYPAISMPISLFTTAVVQENKVKDCDPVVRKVINNIKTFFPKTELDIGLSISSNIPQNFGMGSSAALSHAIAKTIAHHYGYKPSKKKMFTIVQSCEQIFHGKPSGVDAATVVYETCIRFQKTTHGYTINKLNCADSIPNYLLIDSGKSTETTKEMVERVGMNKAFSPLLEKIGNVTLKIEKNLKSHTFENALIDENEELLEELGIVGDHAKNIIQKIRKSGGSAKISGAGGVQSGSGVILAFHKDIRVLQECCTINRFIVHNS